MIEYASWAEPARLLVTFLLALCTLSQTLAVIAGFFRRPPGGARVFENLLETAVLIHVLACSSLSGRLEHAMTIGLIPQTGYETLRVAVFAIITALAVAIFITRLTGRTAGDGVGLPTAQAQDTGSLSFCLVMLAVPGAFLTLPLTEPFAGRGFAWLFVSAILFWLVRSIIVFLLRYREIRAGVSGFTVKNAIDRLNTAVMFCENDGFVLLSNAKMLWLMRTVTGAIHRNGNYFFGLVTQGKVLPGCSVEGFEGQNACLLPDGSVWILSKNELLIKKRRYFQLSATDVTERWKLTEELKPQNERLRQQSEELKETIANLQLLSRERETQKARMRAHDILGERLTLLLRMIRSEQDFDYALLKSMSHGLLDELRAARSAHSPQNELEALRQAFGVCGVEILYEGSLPGDEARARLVVEIVREGVTNAVRHGFATQAFVSMGNPGDGYKIKISDNGSPSSDIIVEGGGLGGIRTKLKPFGGALNVNNYPNFVLDIELPEEEAHVRSVDR